MLFVMLLAVSTVSATDNVTDDTVVGTSDNVTNDVVGVSDETFIKTENQSEELITVEENVVVDVTEENKLNTSPGTFTDLANDISNAGNELTLTKDYVYNKNDIDYLNSYDYKNGIIIDKEITINGNGFSINGQNTARAFIISSNNVILKNISFTNCSRIVSTSSSYGAAICWNGGDGNLINCNFNDCNMILSASYSYKPSIYGGAVYWNGTNGLMNYCIFNKCYLLHSSSYPSSSYPKPSIYGGAVYWEGSNGHMVECIFNKCNASICPSETSLSSPVYGGAIYWNGQNGYLEKCNFKECYVLHSSSYMASASPVYGGAIYWSGAEGNLINSNFEDCHASYSFQSQSQIISPDSDVYGGAIYWEGSTGYLSNSTFVNCYSNASSKTSSYLYSHGGAIYWNGADGILDECIFNSCSALDDASVSSSNEGGAVYWGGFRGILNNCSFDNCTTSSSSFSYGSSNIGGGAIFWQGDEGNLVRCIFNNCFSSNSHYSSSVSGGAIYWIGSNSKLVDSNFYNCHVSYSPIDSDSYPKTIEGGAVFYYCYNSFLSNCTFINCSTKSYKFGSSSYSTYIEGGAISLGGSYGYLSNSTFVNCSTMSVYSENYLSGGAIDSSMDNLSIIGCNFINCTSDEGSAVHITGGNSTLMYSNFTNCSCTKYNQELYVCVVWGGRNGTLSYCNFENCSSSSNKFIYWYKSGGTLGYCCFDGKMGPYQEFVYMFHINEAAYVNPMISLNVSDIFLGETQKIIINVDPGLTGNITVKQFNSSNGNILNNQFNLPINQSCFDFLIYNLTEGLYNVTVERNWDMFYNPVKISETFKVMKFDSSINVISNNITVGDELILDITLNENVTGNIFLNINNHQYSKVISNGKATFYVSDLPAGNYSYTINYTGDKKFNPTIYKNTLVVSPAKAEITEIKVQNNTYDENTIINVKTNVAGVLTVKLNNANAKTFNINANRLTAFDLGKYDVGNYDIVLTLDAGSNYTKATGNAKVTVNPKQTTVELNVNNNEYGKNVIVNVTASENGKVTVNVGTNTRTVDVEANKPASIDFGILDAKSYEVNTTFDGGKNYQTSSDKTSLVVSPKVSTVALVDFVNSYVYGQNVIIKMKSDTDGTLTVKMGNTPQTKQVTAGNPVTFNFGILNVNNYGVTINLDVGNNYVPYQNTTSITVTPKSTTVTLVDSVNSYTYSENLIIKVKTDTDGTLTVKVGDTPQTKQAMAGNIISFNFGILNVNNYDVTISLDAGNNYVPYQNTTSITISPKSTVVTLNTRDYDADEKVIVNLTASENGKATIKLGNVIKNVDVMANKIASLDFGVLSTGSYDVVATFAAGNNYMDSSDSTNIKVLAKIDEKDIDISIPEIKPNQENNIVINLPEDATGTVTLIIGDNAYTFNVKNGIANINVPKLDEGNYKYVINYSGDSKYSSFENTGSIDVAKPDPEIVIPPLDKPSEDGSVAIKLPSDATGTVTLVINGKAYSFPVINGVANVYMPELNAGNYNYSITYSGDGKYSPFTNVGSMNVAKKPVTITALSVSTVYNGGKYIVATLKDGLGNPISGLTVSINVNGKTSTLTTYDNGQVKLTVNGLAPKSYTATVKFGGNAKYYASTKSVKVTVKKATLKLTAKAKTFKKSVKTKKYTVTLKTNQNKVMKNTKVTLKVNGKTFSATTNSKGQATFKITKLTKKGKFNAVVTYKGNAYYNKLSKKVQIKIN